MFDYGIIFESIENNKRILRNSKGVSWEELTKANPSNYYIATDLNGHIINMSNKAEEITVHGLHVYGIDSDYGYTFGYKGTIFNNKAWDNVNKKIIDYIPPIPDKARPSVDSLGYMTQAVYDPDKVAKNVFDADNIKSGKINKFYTDDIGKIIVNDVVEETSKILDNKADKTRKITAGKGLSGGGDLNKDVAIDLSKDTLDKLNKADTAIQQSNLKALAFKDKVEVSDIDAVGNASSETYLNGSGEWKEVNLEPYLKKVSDTGKLLNLVNTKILESCYLGTYYEDSISNRESFGITLTINHSYNKFDYTNSTTQFTFTGYGNFYGNKGIVISGKNSVNIKSPRTILDSDTNNFPVLISHRIGILGTSSYKDVHTLLHSNGEITGTKWSLDTNPDTSRYSQGELSKWVLYQIQKNKPTVDIDVSNFLKKNKGEATDLSIGGYLNITQKYSDSSSKAYTSIEMINSTGYISITDPDLKYGKSIIYYDLDKITLNRKTNLYEDLTIGAIGSTETTPLIPGNIKVLFGDVIVEKGKIIGDGSKITNQDIGKLANFATLNPDGYWIEPRGQLLFRKDYPELWKIAENSGLIVDDVDWLDASKENWGKYSRGDGVNTFRIMDVRGYVIRNLDNGRGVDTGRLAGSYQGDAIRDIKGSFSAAVVTNHNSYCSGAFVGDKGNATAGSNRGTWGFNFDVSRVHPTAPEVRVKNLAYPAFIKYR